MSTHSRNYGLKNVAFPFVRFEVLSGVGVKIRVLWDVICVVADRTI